MRLFRPESGRRTRSVKKAATRVVGYVYDVTAPEERAIDETELEKLLSKAVRDGVIDQFDTGRGRTVWFDGWPGPRLRTLRDQVVKAMEVARARAGLPQRQLRSRSNGQPQEQSDRKGTR